MADNNMGLYNLFRDTPNEARKTINAGRLKGFTDINPMWRIKRLTEVFGPVGIGWKYEITSQRIQEGAGGESAAFVDILLYYKRDGAWSEGIPGIGGASFIANERNGLHTSDECFKMALTDAIGTACKALGMSADIFFERDRTKYDHPDEPKPSADNPVDKAASYVLAYGPYAGETLGSVWNKDIGYIGALRKAQDVPQDLLDAIETINQAAKRKSAT